MLHDLKENLSSEDRAIYYEATILTIVELVLKHGHASDTLSQAIADCLRCKDRLPDYPQPFVKVADK